MAKYPIKMLLDEFKRPFFPLVTVDTIVTNNSDKTQTLQAELKLPL